MATAGVVMLRVFACLLCLAGCKKDSGFVWERFNGEDDVVEIAVEPGDVSADAAETALRSNTGASDVALLRVTPAAGPVGTTHRVTVDVGAAFEERVGRVDVEVRSDARGTVFWPMEQDSADLGLWVVDLVSFGVEGESRTDEVTARLFELVEELPEADTD